MKWPSNISLSLTTWRKSVFLRVTTQSGDQQTHVHREGVCPLEIALKSTNFSPSLLLVCVNRYEMYEQRYEKARDDHSRKKFPSFNVQWLTLIIAYTGMWSSLVLFFFLHKRITATLKNTSCMRYRLVRYLFMNKCIVCLFICQISLSSD